MCVQKKVDAIKTFYWLTVPIELRSFFSNAGYFQRFVRGLIIVSAVLHALTWTKWNKSMWKMEIELDFQTSMEKHVSPSTPVIAYLWFDASFVVETGAFAKTIDVVLAQKGKDEKTHFMLLVSRKINAIKKTFSMYQWHALAIVFALEMLKFSHWPPSLSDLLRAIKHYETFSTRQRPAIG